MGEVRGGNKRGKGEREGERGKDKVKKTKGVKGDEKVRKEVRREKLRR